MSLIRKRITIIILIAMLFAVSSFLIVKSIYYNKVPKSAKLVLHLENNDYITGKNKIVTSDEGGYIL
ncbi:MAG: hypothetical protein PWR06_1072 [Thermoanaerobacteraceae bacterium]|nr:hypothetical protein [Thermoanaerobacteraceae bacterium]MDN5300695.1 hypothetical protein [Thermoanaerobacteraceae bacterium]MDN5311407.1 hypothetical protein [Thermoanaerobacteraceae bacterium]RKL64198.1 hypothetical protein DXT63_02240 [Thermoanaerobacteraceae bacterium SP2]